MKNYHVKKNDKVVVIAGAYKGAEAVVSAVITKNDRVVLAFTENKDRKIGKRSLRKSQANTQGSLVERSVSVHVSNVAKVADDAAKKAE
jgi:large subunit ribosomal protein L24